MAQGANERGDDGDVVDDVGGEDEVELAAEVVVVDSPDAASGRGRRGAPIELTDRDSTACARGVALGVALEQRDSYVDVGQHDGAAIHRHWQNN